MARLWRLARRPTYIVEEFVDGVVPTQIDGDGLDQLLRANALQADVRPETDRDWSSYIHAVVFDGDADLAARMRARPVTAACSVVSSA